LRLAQPHTRPGAVRELDAGPLERLADRVRGRTLLIPRVNYWPQYGWRAEAVIDDLATGDIIIGEFVETREEAQLMAEGAVAKAAASERALRRARLGLR
jgi:hypothetical protein